MNNLEKTAVLKSLTKYWEDRHPDCCMDLPDGRHVFRQELLDYKHDMLITTLYAKLNNKTKTWPMWVAIGIVFVMEALRYV